MSFAFFFIGWPSMKKQFFLLFSLLLLTNAKAQSPYDIGYFSDADQLQSPSNYVQKRKQKIAVLGAMGLDHVVRQFPTWMGNIIGKNIQIVEEKVKDYYKDTNFEVDSWVYTDRFTLWNVLTSPDYVAIFWVGHGSDGSLPEGPETKAQSSKDLKGVKGNVEGEGNIYDGDAFEITDVLTTIHPNLRFLTLIGCSSSTIRKTLSKIVDLKKTNPKLTVITYDDKVSFKEGIDKSLKWSPKILNRRSVRSGYKCEVPLKKGIEVHLQRVCAGSNLKNIGLYPAITVATTSNNRIIGAFPVCQKKGEIQKLRTHIALDSGDFDKDGQLIHPDKLNLIFTSGQRIYDSYKSFAGLNLGKITAKHKGQEIWLGIIDPDNEEKTHVDVEILTYLEGSIDRYDLVNFHEFLCQDMPARK